MEKRRIPTGKLTIIIRDDGPLVHAGDSPSYRTVQIQLTPEQRKQIELRLTHSAGQEIYYESISQCILEPEFKEY
jgi:hypothetical protein